MVLALSVVGCAEATTDEAPDAIEGAGGMETQGSGGMRMRGTGGYVADPAPECNDTYVQGTPCTGVASTFNKSGSECMFCLFEGSTETPPNGCAVRADSLFPKPKHDFFCVYSNAQCASDCSYY